MMGSGTSGKTLADKINPRGASGQVKVGRIGRKRRGLISIDYVIGFAVMLVIIGVGISFVVWVTTSPGLFEAVARQTALRSSQEIQGETSWTLIRTPVIIESAGTNLPVEIGFVPTSLTDLNSIVVTDAEGNPVPSEFDNATQVVAWDAFLRPGRNIFYVVNTEGTAMKPINWTGVSDISTQAVAGGLRIKNARFNTSLGPSGVFDLLIDGERPLLFTEEAVPRIDLGPTAGTATPQFKVGPARAVTTYENGITSKVFANDSKIWIQAPRDAPIPAVKIEVSPGMTRYYSSTEGEEKDIVGGIALLEDHITDLLNIYNPTDDIGLTVLGAGKQVNVTLIDNIESRVILVNNATSFYVFAHRGDFNTALEELHLAANPPNITIGAPVITSGIARPRFQIAATQALIDYEAFKRAHQLFGFDYNVTIEEIRR